MANPKKENGYVSISNELLEQIYGGRFSISQLKIILLVCRYTYGFNRKAANLSNRFIANGTGLHEVTVSREVSALQNGNVLKVFEKPKSHSARVIGLNKDYDSWSGQFSLANSLTKNDFSLAERLVSIRVSGNSSLVSEPVNFGLADMLTKKDNIRKTTKKDKEIGFSAQKNGENRGDCENAKLNDAGFPIIDFGLSKSKEDF